MPSAANHGQAAPPSSKLGTATPSSSATTAAPSAFTCLPRRGRGPPGRCARGLASAVTSWQLQQVSTEQGRAGPAVPPSALSLVRATNSSPRRAGGDSGSASARSAAFPSCLYSLTCGSEALYAWASRKQQLACTRVTSSLSLFADPSGYFFPGGYIMEALISAVAGELVSRFISFLSQNFFNRTLNGDDDRRLEQVLLRVRTIVEEAEGRRITNRGMLLQLKMLMEGMYEGHYILDRFKIQSAEQGEVSDQNRSSAMSALTAAKRLRFTSATTEHTLVAFGTGSSIASLKGVLGSLEAKIQDMREFVVLLGSCPRLPRQPYCTYLFMDKCMFGRHAEKEHVINFLLCNDDTHDECCPNLGILPIIGPHRVGKKTLVQHACKDERVRDFFSEIFFFKGDDLESGEFTPSLEAASGKRCLFVVEFSSNVDEAAWESLKSSFQKVAGHGSKVVMIGRTQQVAKCGTAMPVWMKSLSQEEYWYYFKALAFGSMDPDEHPKLASLGMQLAAELKGSFLGANILGELLRSNPNAQFWHAILSSVRGLVQEHMFSHGVHPEDLLERNVPVGFTSVSFVAAQSQACLVYDLREAGPGQEELPLPTSREVLTGVKVPIEEKFDVLVWKSRIPPYCSYIATYERQEAPQRRVGKKNRLALRDISS